MDSQKKLTEAQQNLTVSHLALQKEQERVITLEQGLPVVKKALADRNAEIDALKSESSSKESQIIRDFDGSQAFQAAALAACAPTLNNGIYASLLAFQRSGTYQSVKEVVPTKGMVSRSISGIAKPNARYALLADSKIPLDPRGIKS